MCWCISRHFQRDWFSCSPTHPYKWLVIWEIMCFEQLQQVFCFFCVSVSSSSRQFDRLSNPSAKAPIMKLCIWSKRLNWGLVQFVVWLLWKNRERAPLVEPRPGRRRRFFNLPYVQLVNFDLSAYDQACFFGDDYFQTKIKTKKGVGPETKKNVFRPKNRPWYLSWTPKTIEGTDNYCWGNLSWKVRLIGIWKLIRIKM